MKRAARWLMAGWLGAAALGVVTTHSETAEACGGFFCSRTPVDQTAERILFTVNDDATVTAYIQITYAGDRDNFAWVVPVPGEVDPGQFSQLALTALDTATQPQYSTNACFDNDCPFCFSAAGGGGVGAPTAEMSSGVEVLQTQTFGPYDSVTIIGDDADELVLWLQDNGYRITDSMIPYIAQYVEDGLAFFAMKLLPEADTEDITPVSITYDGQEPMIPIRLTAVASEPEMSIVAWVLGDGKYGPGSYADVAIPDELIEFDPNSFGTRTNYLTVVSKEVDKVGGHGMVTEYADTTEMLLEQVQNSPINPNIEGAEEAQADLVAVLSAHPYITRMYSRMSAEEMTFDPYFAPLDDDEVVDRFHALQCVEGSSIACECPDGSEGVRNCGQPSFGWYGGCECGPQESVDAGAGDPVDSCGSIVPSPCAFTYCGRFGSCVGSAAESDPVCVCDTGTTARARTTTPGAVQLYCEPLTLNFATAAAEISADAPDFSDPCDGYSCGANGQCAAMNGNPSCICDAGFGARVTTTTLEGAAVDQITCVEVTGIVPALPVLPAIGSTEMPEGMEPRAPGEPATESTMPTAMMMMPMATSTGATTTGSMTTPMTAPTTGEPGAATTTPETTPASAPVTTSSGGCATSGRLASNGAPWSLLLLLGTSLGWSRRRRNAARR